MYGPSRHVLKGKHGSEEYKETNKTEPPENEEWYIENIEWPEVGQLFNMSINIVTTKIIDDHFNMITQNKEQERETDTGQYRQELGWRKQEEIKTQQDIEKAMYDIEIWTEQEKPEIQMALRAARQYGSNQIPMIKATISNITKDRIKMWDGMIRNGKIGEGLLEYAAAEYDVIHGHEEYKPPKDQIMPEGMTESMRAYPMIMHSVLGILPIVVLVRMSKKKIGS